MWSKLMDWIFPLRKEIRTLEEYFKNLPLGTINGKSYYTREQQKVLMDEATKEMEAHFKDKEKS